MSGRPWKRRRASWKRACWFSVAEVTNSKLGGLEQHPFLIPTGRKFRTFAWCDYLPFRHLVSHSCASSQVSLTFTSSWKNLVTFNFPDLFIYLTFIFYISAENQWNVSLLILRYPQTHSSLSHLILLPVSKFLPYCLSVSFFFLSLWPTRFNQYHSRVFGCGAIYWSTANSPVAVAVKKATFLTTCNSPWGTPQAPPSQWLKILGPVLCRHFVGNSVLSEFMRVIALPCT